MIMSIATVMLLTNLTNTKLRDNNSYTTTNKCLRCLLKIMYTVF